MHIVIDAMGGDCGLSVTIPSVIKAVQKWSDIQITLVGNEQDIVNYLTQHHHNDYQQLNSKITIQHASEHISMEDHPVQALRQKKDSSMHVALKMVKEKQAQGCLSAGNTGALMAISTMILRTIKCIERPAICSPLPSQRGWVYVLDLGANVEVSAQQLYQFALMGTAMVQATENIAKPKVGLMNVGSEEIKGNKTTQEAHQLISDNPQINYQGFIEGDDIYMGNMDVVVMGGLEGNIALKTSEGLAKYIKSVIKAVFTSNMLMKAMALLCSPALNKISKQLSPSKYNGACFIGLNGIVVKSHGNADIGGFIKAIGVTRKLILDNTTDKITHLLST